jgi:PKD repeat protein
VKNLLKIIVTVFFLIEGGLLLGQTSSCYQPKNNLYTADTLITFSANKVPGAISYRFQISSTSDFSNLMYDTILAPRDVLLQLPNINEVYFWRTKSYLIGDSTNWSPFFILNLFSPTNVSNTILWLSSKNISLPNNTLVNTWNDLSSYSHHATQASAALQPLFKINGGFRNNSFIDFVGSDGMATSINNIDIPNDSTLGFISLNINRNQGYGALFYLGNSGAYTPLYAGRTAGSSYSNGAMRFLGYNGSSFNFDIQTPNSTHKIITGINTKLTAKLFSSGIQMTTSIASVVPVANGATLKIGSNQDFQENYNGGVHEFIMLKNTSDTSVYHKIEKFIDCRYVPRANLGGNVFKYNGFCDSTITLSPGSGFSSYTWSTGATSPTLSVNTFGTYSVTVVDEFGYIHFDQIDYKPNLFLRYPSTNFICSGDSVVWDTQIPSGYTVHWSDGTTGSVKYISSAVTLSYQVMDASLCSYPSEAVTFFVDNYEQFVTLGNDTTLCANNLIALQSGAAETVSYIWPTVTPNDQASYSVVTTGDYWVETTNVNGCVARDTINVTVSGVAPIADFSFLGQCQNANVAFTDGSAPIGADLIASWTWDMGEGTVLSAQDPGHTYTTPGIYTVELYVESIGGCGAFHTETVTVFAAPIANFSYTGYCAEYAIPFTNLSVNGSAPIVDYFWNFDMPWTGTYNNSVVSAPNRNFPTAATFMVSLQVTDVNGCVSDTVLPVLIDPTPIVDFSYNPACENSAIQFTNLSTSESSSTISWNFGDNTYSILTNPSKTFQDFGLQLVTLQVTNPNGCMGEKQHQVEVFPNPVALLDHGPSCKGSYVSLDNVSTIPAGYIDSSIWIINSIDTLYGASANYLLNTLGQNNFQLITFSEFGCRSEVNEFVDVTIELNASFTAGTGLVAAGSPFSFVNTSTSNSASAVASLWFFDDGQFSSDYSPEHVFDTQYIDSTLYPYLIIMNTEGCIDTAFQTIYLKRGELDLSLTNVYLEQQGNFSIVGVKMKNMGTVNIEKAELKLESTKGLLFQEVWTGVILPNAEYIYIFNATPLSTYSDQNEQDAFICVNGIGYDALGVAETYLGNNYECENIEGTAVILMPVVPNPAVDQIELGIIVSEANEVVIDLYDALGKKVKNLLPSATWEIGTYHLVVDIRSVQNGVYFVRMNSGGKIVNEKILISNN